MTENVPDGFHLQIKKTACMGTCPVFNMEISGDGMVQYQGKVHVALIGSYSKQLPAEKMIALVEVMKSSKFWDYEALYDKANVTDLPMSLLSCTLEDRSHTVKSRAGGPAELEFLIQTLLRIVGQEGFVAVGS